MPAPVGSGPESKPAIPRICTTPEATSGRYFSSNRLSCPIASESSFMSIRSSPWVRPRQGLQSKSSLRASMRPRRVLPPPPITREGDATWTTLGCNLLWNGPVVPSHRCDLLEPVPVPLGCRRLSVSVSLRRKRASNVKPTMEKSIAVIFAVSNLFLAGCCTPNATKWEYKVASPPHPPTANDAGPQQWQAIQQQFLNDLGKDGWVLVSETDGRIFYLKRPMK
jgi:hypothetical protein